MYFFSARSNIMYPMLFKLSNPEMNRYTHCGVLEFVADEGLVYLPYWVSICVSGEVANVLDCDIVVSKFKFQSSYCVHFQTNDLWESCEFLYLTLSMSQIVPLLFFY